MLRLFVWKNGPRFGFVLTDSEGEVLDSSFGHKSESRAIKAAESVISDDEYRLEVVTRESMPLQYASAMASAEAGK
jgi:uncharacterized protein YegP (UPF0339 family)